MNTMRPDELASLSQIESNRKSDERLKSGFKTAVNLGLAATGAGLSARVAPFLSDMIPVDLAFKGINKLSPKLGSFLKKGMEQGLNLKDGLNFIKENLGSDNQEPAKDNRSIIEQYSPELHQFLNQEIQNGRSPIQAAALAQHDKRFESVIKKMVKDHKTNWSNIIESVFGTAQQPQLSQTQQVQPQQGGSQALQNLMAALQAAQSRRSKP